MTARVVAFLGAFLAIGFGAYLLLVGRDITWLTPDGQAGVIREPSLAGVIPISIGAIALWGVLRRRLTGLWLAAGLAVASSVAFLFSLSLQFAALAAVLFVAATMSTLFTRSSQPARTLGSDGGTHG
jgi:hypothetical protein